MNNALYPAFDCQRPFALLTIDLQSSAERSIRPAHSEHGMTSLFTMRSIGSGLSSPQSGHGTLIPVLAAGVFLRRRTDQLGPQEYHGLLCPTSLLSGVDCWIGLQSPSSNRTFVFCHCKPSKELMCELRKRIVARTHDYNAITTTCQTDQHVTTVATVCKSKGLSTAPLDFTKQYRRCRHCGRPCRQNKPARA